MNSYNDDIKHIRKIMERSTTFLSLSGWSGIFAGMIAISGSIAVFYNLNQYSVDYFDSKPILIPISLLRNLIVIAFFTLITALFAAYYFTSRKSQKLGLPLWSSPTKKMLQSLLLPLLTGGIFSIALIWHGTFFMVAPSMLIFYGIALINASHHTKNEIFWLGILELILGLISSVFTGYGLVFWTLGFGVLHIVYGVLMQVKYK